MVKATQKLEPDLIVADVSMPLLNGIDAARQIRKTDLKVKIIFLSMHPDVVYVSEAFQAGGSAYVLKSMVRAQILDTIRAVHAGEKRIQTDVAAEIAMHTADAPLTAREIEVLRLVAAGHANKTISVRLGINEETTKTHVKNILAKLGAKDRTHAVSLGLKRGIISL